MRKYCFIFLFTLIQFEARTVYSQNLVPNPSFEDTVYCPDNIDSIDACAGWHSGWQPLTTPNYFNTCSSNPDVSPPDVIWGYQQPHSGNAFCYVATYLIFAPNKRETIQATLIQSLNIGQQYFVSFYISFPGLGANNIVANKLGALFTTKQFTVANFAVPHNFAQVYTDSILTDTANWFHLKGSFIADSAYQYIALGNFFDDAHTDTSFFTGSSPIASGYFIDDVCVSTDSDLCFKPSALNELIVDDGIRIFPNPASQSLQVIAKPLIKDVIVFDLFGNRILKISDSNISHLTINCSSWEDGLYLLQLNSTTHKIQIIH